MDDVVAQETTPGWSCGFTATRSQARQWWKNAPTEIQPILGNYSHSVRRPLTIHWQMEYAIHCCVQYSRPHLPAALCSPTQTETSHIILQLTVPMPEALQCVVEVTRKTNPGHPLSF
jgi:hypothetical protein